jgi:hypothetical protein
MIDVTKIASTQDISALMQQIGAQPSYFSPSSRYYTIPVVSLTTSAGESVPYIKRRFVPQADSFATLQLYTVKQADRLDNIAYQFIGDPERFWQICDANSELEPGEITEQPGNTIRITLPQGIPGNTNA